METVVWHEKEGTHGVKQGVIVNLKDVRVIAVLKELLVRLRRLQGTKFSLSFLYHIEGVLKFD